ncbi:alanine racemase [Geopsychrobacter electrodiphilus]|uniref:alanine racemase n=1 Tax=Geopsychrobacter electrodiphilus TaxID=225196 RepID=UPI0003743CD7|nr:alanine racemase [Geopsychrobacter electrodiphilus]
MIAHSLRPTRADIDLSALAHNLQQVRSCCHAGQGVMAVVKADAYGHGAVTISRALEAEGVEQFAVATLEEGQELRGAGIKRPILVFGGCYPGQEAAFVEYALTAALLSLADVKRLEAFGSAQEKPFLVHIKCDTGMGRVGLLPEEIPQLITLLSQSCGLEVRGLMSHLASADDLASPVTSDQVRVFREILDQFKLANITIAEIHLGSSAGLCAWPLPEATLVRPGIMLYGGYPSAAFTERLDLRPVMTFSTQIAQLRTLAAGQGISYGHTHQTRGPTRLAALPVGYADGYNRLFSNCGEVLVHGQRVSVVGRVCMDWILVDVTEVADVAVGDRVVLLGSDGEETISAEDWAEKLDTINYEVFCRISQRVPRYPHSGPFVG